MNMPASMEAPNKIVDLYRRQLERVRKAPLGRVYAAPHGEMNRVLVAPNSGLVFRFPHHIASEDPTQAQLYKDISTYGAVVHSLVYDASTRRRSPVRIAKCMDIGYTSDSENVAYTCYEQLPGSSIADNKAIQHWSIRERRHFGATVASCIAWLAVALPARTPWRYAKDVWGHPSSHLQRLDRLRWVRQALPPNEVPAWYYKEKYPGLTAVLEQLAPEIAAQESKGELTMRIFGHHDLRPENFLFTKNPQDEWEACAWLDFDTARPSTPAREMQFLLMLGSEALTAATGRYKELTGQEIDSATVLFWLKIHHAGGALYSIAQDNNFGRAFHMRGLRWLYPDIPYLMSEGI